MPEFRVNGHSLHYEFCGDGDAPPLVFLHQGLGASAEWQAQVDHFASRYRVITFDRWGYGRSDVRPRFEHAYLWEDAQEAIALLDHLWVQDACLWGHSDGGTIALIVAGLRPDLVRAMVIEAAHIYYEPKIGEGIGAMLAKVHSRASVQAYLAALHGNRWQALAETWLNHWADARNIPAELVAPDLLRRIACPVLVVQGAEDEYATDQHALDIASALPNSELWLIPGAGHTPHAALGDAFTQRVAEFFDRQLG